MKMSRNLNTNLSFLLLIIFLSSNLNHFTSKALLKANNKINTNNPNKNITLKIINIPSQNSSLVKELKTIIPDSNTKIIINIYQQNLQNPSNNTNSNNNDPKENKKSNNPQKFLSAEYKKNAKVPPIKIPEINSKQITSISSIEDLDSKIDMISNQLQNLNDQQLNLMNNLNDGLDTFISNSLHNNSVDTKNLNYLQENLLKILNNKNNTKKLIKLVKEIDLKIKEISEKQKSIDSKFHNFEFKYTNIKLKLISDDIDFDQKMQKLDKKIKFDLNIEITITLNKIEVKLKGIKNLKKNFEKHLAKLDKYLPDNFSECTIFNTCGGCNAQKNCGWCATSNRCIRGDEKGPNKNERCLNNGYSKLKCLVPRACETYKDCKECINNLSCGWCISGEKPQCIPKIAIKSGKCNPNDLINSSGSFNICPFDPNINKTPENKLDKNNSILNNIPPNKNFYDFPNEIRTNIIEEYNFNKKILDEINSEQKNLEKKSQDLKNYLTQLDNAKDVVAFIVGVKDNPKTKKDLIRENKEVLNDILPVIKEIERKIK